MSKAYNKHQMVSILARSFSVDPTLFTQEYRSYFCNRRILMRAEREGFNTTWLILLTQDHVRSSATLQAFRSVDGSVKACTIDLTNGRPNAPIPTMSLDSFLSKLMRDPAPRDLQLYEALAAQRGRAPGTMILHTEPETLGYRDGTLSIDLVFKSESTTYDHEFYKIVVLRVRDVNRDVPDELVAVLFNAGRGGRDVYASGSAPLFSPAFKTFMGLYRDGCYHTALTALVDPDNKPWIQMVRRYPFPSEGRWCLCWTRPLFYISETDQGSDDRVLVEDVKFKILDMYRITGSETKAGVRYLHIDGPDGPCTHRDQHFIFL